MKSIGRICILIAICFSCKKAVKNNSKSEENLKSIILNLELHYDSLYVFLANCYDKERGGFYEYPGAEGVPKIESTARAITMLDKAGILHQVPQDIKNDMVNYLQQNQDSETGFFEDLQEKRDAKQRRGRALGYSVGALKKLGAESLYPLPGTDAKVGVEHIQSPEAFVAWMKGLDWNKPWSVGGAVSSQRGLIENLPAADRQAILDAAFAFLSQKQDAQTGWWGADEPYHMLSGAFKLGLFYKAFDKPMPNGDKIYESVIKTVKEEECHDGCWVRNTLHLLDVIKPGYQGIAENDKLLLVQKLSKNIVELKRKDGGYARHDGQDYGVTDGCSQAMKTRDALRKLAGLEEIPFPNGQAFFVALTN